MSFKLKKLILSLCTVLLIVAAIAFKGFFFQNHTGITVFIAAFLVLSVLCVLWWRCPHCKKGLGRSFFGVDYCPRCGKSLDD